MKEIVIKLDEGILQGIVEENRETARHIVQSFQATIADAIKNGTPLPKGHGDLIDRSNLITTTDIRTDGIEFTYVPYSEIEYAPTIIEEDKGE